MALFSRLLGNAAEVDTSKLEQDFSLILVEGEKIEHAYRVVRDLLVFTNRRLVMVDKEGATGKKKEFLSIPYSSITKFSKESAGRFDLEAEVKLWIRGEAEPTVFTFRKDKNVHDVYKVMSAYILR